MGVSLLSEGHVLFGSLTRLWQFNFRCGFFFDDLFNNFLNSGFFRTFENTGCRDLFDFIVIKDVTGLLGLNVALTISSQTNLAKRGLVVYDGGVSSLQLLKVLIQIALKF